MTVFIPLIREYYSGPTKVQCNSKASKTKKKCSVITKFTFLIGPVICIYKYFTFRLYLCAWSKTTGTKSSVGSPFSSAIPGGYHESTITPENTKLEF